MRIGIFSDSYKPYKSGVVSSITTTRETLGDLGHQVYIFAPDYPDYEEIESGIYRYFSVCAPTNKDFSLAIPVFPIMSSLVRRLELDVIHVHSPFTMGRVGMHYANKHRLPLVFTYHTLYEQMLHYVPGTPAAPDLARAVTNTYSRRFCNQCAHIIAPTFKVKEILEEQGVRAPISVIPSGVPLEYYQTVPSLNLRQQHGIDPDCPILLNVGRLTREKNLFFLIKAFKMLRGRGEKAVLVITAQGPMEGALRDYAQRQNLVIGRDIIFAGAVPYENLADVYRSADLFVFSSLIETQALVLFEAMAGGLPVVAIKTECTEAAIADGVEGFLTSEMPDQFGNAISRILNNPEMHLEMSKAARLRAAQMSAGQMGIRLESLYEQLTSVGTKYPAKLI